MGHAGFMPPANANANAREAVLKALEIDQTLAEAHSMMGILRASNYDWKGAEREFLRALEINQESVDAWIHYINYYFIPMRRLDEAVAASRKALELDPLSPLLQWGLGYRLYLTQQLDRAIEQWRNALELDPNYYLAHLFLGIASLHMGNFEEAIRALEVAVRLAGRAPFCLGILGFTFAQAGRISNAQNLLRELQQCANKGYVTPYSFALIYMGLGNTYRALDWLEKGVNEHDGHILHLHVSPGWVPLRSHPRYHTLLRKMNLE
jgi:adenylate cyclase